MRKYNILVTGVGAIIGYGVILSLKKSKYDVQIIGMDIYDDAVGQMWCDEFIQAIPAADEEYITFLKNCIDKYHVDLVFFGTEQEIHKCYNCKKELGDYYKKLVLNKDEIIQLSLDKWNTMNYLKEHGLNYIKSSITANYSEAKDLFGCPLLMKPRRSYASKGIQCVNTEEEFNKWREENKEQFMVQEYIGDNDHEYTVATFGMGDGTCISPIVLRRKLSKAGATDKAIVEMIPELQNEVIKMVEIMKPIGPTNFQFRLHKGNYLLLEINPRISSSTSIRTAFGYNEAEMCIEYFVEKHRPNNREIRSGRAIRYIAEVVEYYDSNNI